MTAMHTPEVGSDQVLISKLCSAMGTTVHPFTGIVGGTKVTVEKLLQKLQLKKSFYSAIDKKKDSYH